MQALSSQTRPICSRQFATREFTLARWRACGVCIGVYIIHDRFGRLHLVKDLPIGTLRSIFRQAGWIWPNARMRED